MIYVICGYAGSGKTSYALTRMKENDVLLDSDRMKECFNIQQYPIYIKSLQLEALHTLYPVAKNIYYITCFPSFKELETLQCFADVEYVWIDTSLSLSLKNIEHRNRQGDCMEELRVFNTKIQDLYLYSGIQFKHITVFDEEKW